MFRLAILAWYNDPLDQIKVAIAAFRRFHVQAISFDAPTLLQCLKENPESIQAILIWNRHQGMDAFPEIRRLFNGKIVLFNWDDPHAIRRSDLETKVDGLDHVFSSDRGLREWYLRFGAKDYSYLPPFYDPDWHYPEIDPKYRHDVAIVCTNLYRGQTTQLVSRYDLVEALDADPDINLGLYGPDSIGRDFPNSYRGFISYVDNHRVFASSTIAISTHIENGDGYLNERCITILASGGLLLMDPINGADLPGSIRMINCTIPDILTQIKDLLTHPEERQKLIQRGMETVQRYHVDRWVETILPSVRMSKNEIVSSAISS